jgi:hypothetical protein
MPTPLVQSCCHSNALASAPAVDTVVDDDDADAATRAIVLLADRLAIALLVFSKASVDR